MRKNTSILLLAYIVLAAFVIVSCTKDEPNEEITPETPKYSIGGTVEGLTGTGLVLKNNNTDSLSITANGIFTFNNKLEDDSAYNVTIKTQPSGQNCIVEDGSGTVEGADVTDVIITCSALPVSGGGNDDPPDNGPDGSITYAHDLANDYAGFHQEITVTGTVPFTCDNSNNLSGSGILSITVSGTITATCTEASYSGSATMNVTLTGTYSNGNLNFNFTEVWYVGSPTVSGSIVNTCDPDTDPYSYPLIENTVQHQLIFPNVNGHTEVRPYSGASGSGTYNWTLHTN